MVEEKLKQKSVIPRPLLGGLVTGPLPGQAYKEQRGHASQVGGPAWDRGKCEALRLEGPRGLTAAAAAGLAPRGLQPGLRAPDLRAPASGRTWTLRVFLQSPKHLPRRPLSS